MRHNSEIYCQGCVPGTYEHYWYNAHYEPRVSIAGRDVFAVRHPLFAHSTRRRSKRKPRSNVYGCLEVYSDLKRLLR